MFHFWMHELTQKFSRLMRIRVFPIVIYRTSDGRIYTKPREKSGRVSLIPEDIHDGQFYKLYKLRTDRSINKPMALTDYCYTKSSQVLVCRQRLHLLDRERILLTS
jgi:hypothetical protein